MIRPLSIVLVVLATASCADDGAGDSKKSCGPDPVDRSGEATYYAADGSGSCTFDPTGDKMVVALGPDDYAGSAACGACIRAVGPNGEVTVRVVDQCPWCVAGDIDLSVEAFGVIADPAAGLAPIHWSYVACDVSGPIVYHFMSGSNPWWLAVQIRNARFAIEKLEIMKDGEYVEVSRQEYNYFVVESGMGEGPFTFRVTDVKGQVLEDEDVPFVAGADAPGAAQLPACGE